MRKFIHVKCPKGYYRTIWVKSHPDVIAAHIEFRKADKTTPLHLIKNDKHVNQNCVSDFIKSAIPLNQKCLTTNNKTIKETTQETSATPAPLPAGGQAPALLAERKAQLAVKVANIYERFGRSMQPRPQLTPEEFERRRREAIEQFKAIQESKAGCAAAAPA